jgi:hypothetical protein
MAAAALAAAKRNAGGGAQVHAQNSPTRSGTDSENDDPVPGFPYVTEGFWKYQKEAQRFYYRTDIQVFVAVLIGLNFLTNVWNAQVFPPEAQIMLAAYGASSPNDMVTSYVDDDEVAFTDVSTDSPMKVSEALWREKYQESSETWFILFGILGTVYNVCFFIELLINMYANWLYRFWADPWNQFDFLVVAIGLMTDAYLLAFLDLDLGPAKLLRNMRAFRVFRLFKRVKSLNKIVVSLGKALTGMMNALLIMLLVIAIYALLAVEFWGQVGRDGYMNYEVTIPAEKIADVATTDWTYHKTYYVTGRGGEYGNEYFGNFFRALYTLFQVLTGESWSEAIARPLIEQNDTSAFGTGFFFVSFIIINQIVLVNVVVAVLLEKMVDDEPDITPQEVAAAQEKKESFPSEKDAIAAPGAAADLTAAPATIPSAGDASPAMMAELRSMREQIDLILSRVDSIPKTTTTVPPLDVLES